MKVWKPTLRNESTVEDLIEGESLEMDNEFDDGEQEATDYEFYCNYCASIVAIDAEECPCCHTKDF